MMQITVKLMGTLKPKQPSTPLELPAGATIEQVMEQLDVATNAVQVTTVNGQLIHDRRHALQDGDELTLLPPVGGG